MKLVRLAIIVAVLSSLLAGSSSPGHAYSKSWTRSQANAYAYDGLLERYVFGGSKFRDNNRWDSDEGADCSGYAAKGWAVEHYTGQMTSYHPYSTHSFYYGFPYQVLRDRRYGGFMQVWVYRSAAGGPGNHMGFYIVKNADGTWNTFEARGSAYGIIFNRRSISTLISWNYRKTDRKNWGGP